MNLPNSLTLSRLFMVPVLILLFYIPYFRTFSGSMILVLFFVVASLTDMLDGYMARKWSQVTALGKFLDPIADKILIFSMLILLVGEGRIAAWITILIISREFMVTGLRLVASLEGVIMAAESLGKYKMFFQSVAIGFLIVPAEAGLYFFEIGFALLWLSIGFSLYSASRYFAQLGVRFNLVKT